MNIFALDIDPQYAAQSHCDAHVRKMTLETAQILSTVNRWAGIEGDWFYKSTHLNHPCTKWARETQANYKWLWYLGVRLSAEFEYRFGKEHKSSEVICNLCDIPGIIPYGKLTKFALAMPDQYKHSNPITAYRAYYNAEKRLGKLGTWTRRKPPEWWMPF